MTAKQPKRRSSVHGPGRGTPRTPLHAGGGGIAAAALAFLATLLLAPGAARAAQECGGPQLATLTCSMTSYSDGIYYGGSANEVYGSGGTTLNIAGSGAATTTITSGTSQSVGVHVGTLAGQNRPFTLNIGGATGGTAHVVNIVQGTNTNTDVDRNNGVYILDQGQFSGTTVDLKRGVTIGSAITPMKQHGIQVRLDGAGLVGTGEATITSAAPIFAAKRGIWVWRNPGTTTATNSATTITNHGDITSGEEGIYLDYSAATSNAHTRGATITNHGDITLTGAKIGILMDYRSLGDAKITNRGDIIATQSSADGILLQHTGSAGGATVINSGDITSDSLAISVKTSKKIAAGTTAGASVTHEGGDIRVANQAGILVSVGEEDDTTANNAGDAELTVMGGSVEARDEALVARNRQAGNVVIEVSEGVTLTSRDGHGILGDLPSSNVVGGVTIINAAAITAAEVGILVRRTAPANAGIISITNHGAIKRTGDDVDFDGIRVEDDRGKGRVTVTNSGDIGEAGAMAMYRHGIQVQKTGSSGDISVTTTGGSITAKDRGIMVTDNDGHTGAVTISNGGDVTADRPIYVNRDGAGPVTITNTGGTVRTESSHAIYAWNKTGDASDVRVNVEGGTVQSSRSALNFAHVNVVHAFNRGTGDVIVDVADGATLISKVSDAVYANLDSTTLAPDNQEPDNQVKITQGGRMMGRTGVYARAGGYGVAAEGEEVAARAEGNPDVIDVTWTGSFSHGTTEAEKAMVAQNDEGRFSAANVSDLVVFSQYIEAERATDGLYGSAAGVEAAVMPRRTADSTGILQVVAAGDAPNPIADAGTQTNLLSETHADSKRTAILAQFRAMLRNKEIDAASSLVTDIETDGTEGLSDEEIVAYLGANTGVARTALYFVLFGLSDEEKAVLAAVATGEGVDAALTAAGFTDDTADDEDYWSKVMALLDRYNPGNIKIAMNGGSIASRGDGIRAYYATPHDNNGAISVSVAEGAEVTGANAGVYVANAGEGLMLARKYTYGFGMNDGATADDLVAVTHGEGADAVALRKQLVTVAGTVTGGTEAAVRLSGGGAVIVMEGGKVHAGASGVGILADAPAGPALVYVDGEVKGGEGGAAAVHLTGGGNVIVGLNGRVQANGADHAIRGGGDAATMVALTLVTDRLIPYREDVNARVEGSLEDIEGNVRFREDRDGVPTGYSTSLAVTAEGVLDTSKFPPQPREQFDCAADGPCVIDQGETISDRRTGVYAAVPHASESGETRAAADQPLIDVTWTGTFSHAEGSSDEGRFEAETVGEALVFDRESAAGKAVEETIRWDAPAGIEAHALSWRDVAEQVAKGDDPGAIADAAAQTAAVPTGATARDNAYVAAFRAALENGDLTVAPAVLTAIETDGTEGLDDDEIAEYLGTDDDFTRALLRNVLAQGLSDKEEEVLKAVAAGDSAGLTTALDDADAGFTAAYKTAVRELLERYNVGDVRITMNGGDITTTRGDGIRAYYATPHDLNGGVSVTVAKGASVTGARAGVYVANAGEGLRLARKYTPGYSKADENRRNELVAVMHGEGADAVPLRNQLVTVAGTVTGGTDAAVHLAGGGAVLVMEGGKVHAGASGVGILVNDPGPAVVYVDGEVTGGEGGGAAVHLTGGGSVIVGLNGKVEANGADRVIRGGDDAATLVALTLVTDGLIEDRDSAEAAYARVEGPTEDVEAVRFREDRDGVPTGYDKELPVTPDGRLDTSGLPSRPEPDPQPQPEPDPQPQPEPETTFSCTEAMDGRCGLYEALPSVLLAMNGLPSWAERTSAARDGNGGWARVEQARGEWRAKKAATTGELAYDHRRSGVRAGVDFPVGENGRVGVSAHALGGKAQMSGVGEVKLDGMGGGVSATWLAGDLYVDAQAGLTLYDVDVESYTHGGLLKKDVDGAGYALSVDVGTRMPAGRALVTPRGGVSWSKAGLDDFTDMEAMGGPRASVSVEGARSVKGRLGVMAETELTMGGSSGRLFGSLDVEREFSDETEVKVGGQALETKARPTSVRLGAGGAFELDENVVVRATAGYQTSGSGTSGYGGGLELHMRF